MTPKSKTEAGAEGGRARSVAKTKATAENLRKARLAKLLKRLDPSLSQSARNLTYKEVVEWPLEIEPPQNDSQ